MIILSKTQRNPFDELIHASLLDMPLDKKYDFCIFTEVLEHLYDDQVIPALEKLSKIAKYIVITTPTPVTCFQLEVFTWGTQRFY